MVIGGPASFCKIPHQASDKPDSLWHLADGLQGCYRDQQEDVTLASAILEPLHAADACVLTLRTTGALLDLSLAAPTAGSIQAALALCAGAANGKELTSTDQQAARQVLSSPIAAIGVLASASTHLQSSQKWREGTSHDAVGGAFKVLIGFIIPRHPLLLFKVCSPSVQHLAMCLDS